MARSTQVVFVSDLTGEALSEEQAVTVTVKYPDRHTQELDLSISEWESSDFNGKGRILKPRGRQPGTRIKKK